MAYQTTATILRKPTTEVRLAHLRCRFLYWTRGREDVVNQTKTPFSQVFVVPFTNLLQIALHFCHMWSGPGAINANSPTV